MDFFDQFFGKHRDRVRHHGHPRYDDRPSYDGRFDHHRESHYDRGEQRHSEATFEVRNPLVLQLQRNKTAVLLLGLLAALVLIAIIAALAYLLPMIQTLLGSVGENGLKSVLDQAVAFLNKLWLGSGK
jgi:hypothetical protein